VRVWAGKSVPKSAFGSLARAAAAIEVNRTRLFMTVSCHSGLWEARSSTVPADATVPVRVPNAPGSRWYDVTVTSDTDSSYLRVFAGHIETG
jgi:phospholipase C